MLEIAVIGGGAAGIMAAIAAASCRNVSVTIYERNERIGKKILATGNGRCNLTNIFADKKNYHGNNVDFIQYSIDNFWVNETLDFFSGIGLIYKTEDEGKVFPYSNSATSVLDILRCQLEKLKVKVQCGFEVENVSKIKNKFVITSFDKEYKEADRVIVTTGGKASPALGSNGSGYSILEKAGHKITALFPSLVQIKLKSDGLKSLNGIKINAAISVESEQKRKTDETGELLFTDYGISGPVVFAISRKIGERNNCIINIDMMPEYNFNDIVEILKHHRTVMTKVEDLFLGVINKRIGMVLIKMCCDLKMNDDIKKISDSTIKKLAEKIKSFRVESTGTMSWNNAQVTAGGVEVSGFDNKTMESKLVKGLYAAGEILDIDGDCGGYNLQWAWSSGYIAGKSAAGDI